MDVIKSDIEKIFDTTNTGCKVVVENSNTLTVYHCTQWNARVERRIYYKFPAASVDVQTTSLSLSGFKIVIHINNNITSTLLWVLYILLLLFVCYVFRDIIPHCLSAVKLYTHHTNTTTTQPVVTTPTVPTVNIKQESHATAPSKPSSPSPHYAQSSRPNYHHHSPATSVNSYLSRKNKTALEKDQPVL
jgi:hypothetical protein